MSEAFIGAGCDLPDEILHATKEYPVVTDFDFAFGQSRPRKEVGAMDLLQDLFLQACGLYAWGRVPYYATFQLFLVVRRRNVPARPQEKSYTGSLLQELYVALGCLV